MAVVDLTKYAESISGHFFLSYALKKAKEEHKALYDEIANFKPDENNTQYPPEFAFHLAFADKVSISELNIVLIASSLVKACANLFYAKKTDTEMFSILERTTPIQKWTTLPKLFIPNYSLPKSEKKYKTLKVLNERRNSLMHPKPLMSKGEKVLHQGNLYTKTSNEFALHLDFCELPHQLVQNLKSFDNETGFYLEALFLRVKGYE